MLGYSDGRADSSAGGGGSTRSNLGGKISDESFSNQEDLGNFSWLNTLLIFLPIQELGGGGCHG